MKLKTDDITKLCEHLNMLTGRTIKIHESISYNKSRPHQNFATSSGFVMDVRYVGLALSGSQLHLESDISDVYYGVDLNVVSTYDIVDKNKVIIIEHFEQETERVTQITVLH